MPPAAAREKGRSELGITCPPDRVPRPRQGDAVPLHPLLKIGEEKVR